MSQKHFVQLKLRNKTYKDQVSTAECYNVADFKEEIKKKFPLDSYYASQLTLYEADGTTVIDPETSIDKLKEVPWKPMIVTVEEVEQPATQGIAMLYASFYLKFQKTIDLQGNVCRSFL